MSRRHWSSVAKPVPVERRTDKHGRVFDSRGEMVWFNDLEIRQSGGLIRNLRRQVVYKFVIDSRDELLPVLIRSAGFPKGRCAQYTIDAEWDELVSSGLDAGRWHHVWAEYKGYDDPVFALRRGFFEALFLRNRAQVTVFGPAGKKTARKAQKIAASRGRGSKSPELTAATARL